MFLAVTGALQIHDDDDDDADAEWCTSASPSSVDIRSSSQTTYSKIRGRKHLRYSYRSRLQCNTN